MKITVINNHHVPPHTDADLAMLSRHCLMAVYNRDMGFMLYVPDVLRSTLDSTATPFTQAVWEACMWRKQQTKFKPRWLWFKPGGQDIPTLKRWAP